MKIPCETCISFAICKSRAIDRSLYSVVDVCSVLEDFAGGCIWSDEMIKSISKVFRCKDFNDE